MSLLALALGVLLQSPPESDRAVVLAQSHDTAFLLPLASVGRNERTRTATLVNVFAEAEEAWEEERRDVTFEIDCRTLRWRMLGERRIARDGRATEGEGPSRFGPIPLHFPPAAALKAVVCDGADTAAASFPDWESRLPEIRTSLR